MMLNPDQMDQLIAAMRRNRVLRLDVTHGGQRLMLELPCARDLAGATAVPGAGGRTDPATLPVPSPGIGTFAPRGGDDGLPSLSPGATVGAADVLGYIVQGPLRQAVVAPAAGILPSAGLPAPGQLFGHGRHSADPGGAAMKIDINTDMGEGFGPYAIADDDALMELCHLGQCGLRLSCGRSGHHGTHRRHGGGAGHRPGRACQLSRPHGVWPPPHGHAPA
jgi:hypothetical protein